MILVAIVMLAPAPSLRCCCSASGTELEHGPPIIANLLEAVVGLLPPALETQEVEGDAVFAFGAVGC